MKTTPACKLTAMIFTLLLLALPGMAQTIQPSRPPDVTYVYKTTGNNQLHLYFYLPTGWTPSDKRVGVLFIHGGGFSNGTANEYFDHAEYMASRGLVACSMEYRVPDPTQNYGPTIQVYQEVEDGRSAMRWIKGNANLLGIDPTRVIGWGESAGGSMVQTLALGTGPDDSGDNLSISTVPVAMVLDNPAAVGFLQNSPAFGPYASEMNPFINIHAGSPPSIQTYGSLDVNFLTGQGYPWIQLMLDTGNDSELWICPNADHSYMVNSDRYFESNVYLEDQWLNLHGFTTGPPTVTQYVTLTQQNFSSNVTNLPATVLTGSNATLNGIVNPNGLVTSIDFQYGSTTAYGMTTGSTSIGSGSANVNVSIPITGLPPGITHYRLVENQQELLNGAFDFNATAYGSDQTLTTQSYSTWSATQFPQAPTKYYYRVRAFRGTDGQYSGYSNIASATTLALPLAPSNLASSPVNGSTIALTWTNNATDATGVSIERSIDGLNFSQVAQVSPAMSSYTNTGLSMGTAYYYRVSAVRNMDYSAYSSISPVTTYALPTAPWYLNITNTAALEIDLNWRPDSNSGSAEDNSQYFSVYEMAQNSGTWVALATTLPSNTTTFRATGLTPSTSYSFEVSATNPAGNSGFSSSVSGTTSPDLGDIYQDNAATTGVSVSGTWVASSVAAYGTNSINNNNIFSPNEYVTFTPAILTTGTYDVYGTCVPTPASASITPIRITSSQGTVTAYEDEVSTFTNKAWVLLGTYPFTSGTAGSVTYQTTTANGNANGTVYVDGVRYVRVK